MESDVETLIVRMADASMAPRFLAGDYLYVDPAEPVRPGRFVPVRDDRGEITVRLLVAENGGWVLRALAPGWPERALDAASAAAIRGVVVFAGRPVPTGEDE